MSSTPVWPCEDVCGLYPLSREPDGNATDFLDRLSDQRRRGYGSAFAVARRLVFLAAAADWRDGGSPPSWRRRASPWKRGDASHARICSRCGRARTLAETAALICYALAGIHLTIALLTDMPLGVVKIIPMKLRALAEMLVGPVLVIGALALPTFVAGGRGRFVAAGLAIFVVWLRHNMMWRPGLMINSARTPSDAYVYLLYLFPAGLAFRHGKERASPAVQLNEELSAPACQCC
jgi:hypothetical protein